MKNAVVVAGEGRHRLSIGGKTKEIGRTADHRERKGFYLGRRIGLLRRFKPWVFELAKELGIEEDLICTKEENKGTYVFCQQKIC